WTDVPNESDPTRALWGFSGKRGDTGPYGKQGREAHWSSSRRELDGTTDAAGHWQSARRPAPARKEALSTFAKHRIQVPNGKREEPGIAALRVDLQPLALEARENLIRDHDIA